MNPTFDVAIIGGGIVGLATAMALTERGCRSIVVLEAENRGGLSLTKAAAQCVTPEDIVVIAQHRLTYLGHLVGNAAWFPVFSP